MTQLPRQFWGRRDGKLGLWISKPGKNVLTANEDDLLVSPLDSHNNLTFLAKGVREILPRKRVTIPYQTLEGEGITLEREPHILTQVSKRVGGQEITFLPTLQFRMSSRADIGTPSRFRLRPGRTNFTVENEKDRAYLLQYLIIAFPVA